MRHSLFKRIFLFTTLICISAMVYSYPSLEGIQEYEHNINLLPDRKLLLLEDINNFYSSNDIWDVLRQEFTLEHYEEDPRVQEQIQWFLTHQDFLTRSAQRAAPYLYYILQQAHKRHLPVELVLLPMIESSYNPYAYSSAGAAGIWQMMPGSANDYGIKQNYWYDGRRDVIASTKAALNYLSYLGNLFNNDWLLAIAAYDTGLGNVSFAINRNIRDGYTTDFWSLRLAQETRIYVPRLLALAAIVANPDRYPVYFPPIHNAPYLAQLDVGPQVDLHHAASLAGLSFKQLMHLNSGFSHAATDPSGKHKLVLPIENVALFSQNLLQSPLYQQIQQQSYRAKSNAELDEVETHFSIAPSSHKMDPGTKDIVTNARAFLAENEDITDFNQYADPKDSMNSRAADMTATPLSTPTSVEGQYIIQPGDTIYMTRDGDDISKVARRFHITNQELIAANPIDAMRTLHPDQRLVIPTHLQKVQIAKIPIPKPRKHKYHLSNGDTVYMVRAGDTVEKIAQKFHCSPPEIRLANLLSTSDVHDGDRLIIPAHA